MNEPITDWPAQALDQDKSVAEPGEGSGWIQWKGTDVCMDVHCRCGAHGHLDASFTYFYRCVACGVTFAIGQTVRLYPMEPTYMASRGNRCVHEDTGATP